jgi:hypothetical protein
MYKNIYKINELTKEIETLMSKNKESYNNVLNRPFSIPINIVGIIFKKLARKLKFKD